VFFFLSGYKPQQVVFFKLLVYICIAVGDAVDLIYHCSYFLGVTGGARTACLSGAPEFTPGF
jgi:hypothetical protein